MWITLRQMNRFSNFKDKNVPFLNKINKYKKDINMHQKYGEIKDQAVQQFISSQTKEEIASKFVRHASYDQQLKNYIDKFNKTHAGQASLLDFSNYSTSFGQLKDTPLRQSDLQLIRQFQKRKADAKIQKLRYDTKRQLLQHQFGQFVNDPEMIEDALNKPGIIDDDLYDIHKITGKKPPESQKGTSIENEDQQDLSEAAQETKADKKQFSQGPFTLSSNFHIILLSSGITTKITTLNRINKFRVLLFMGNGQGLISYGKGKDLTYAGAMDKAMISMKRNIIAIPRDERCSLPLAINKRFQDHQLHLRPLPGFNPWGHPILSMMISMSGIDHAGFKLIHTGKNIYNICNVLFKSLTTNTTPQQLAEQSGFKVYRHRFIRPLSEQVTHSPLSK